MAENKPTPQQAEAIHYRGSNVLVFASAGGGKTEVLTRRLLERITQDRIALHHMVAITFTDAAAKNMRTKLKKKLTDYLHQHPQDLFVSQQKALLTGASISTIHSFCLSIIQEFGYIIGLPRSLSNNLLEEGMKQVLLEECFHDLQETEDIFSLEKVLSKKFLGYETTKNYLFDCLKKAESTSNPIAWCEEKKHQEAKDFYEIPQDIRQYYFASIKEDLKAALSYGEQALFYAPEDKKELWQNYLTILAEIYKQEDYPLFVKQLRRLSAMPSGPKKPRGQEDPYSEHKFYLEKIAKALGSLAQKIEDPSTLHHHYQQFLPYQHQLLELTKKLYQLYQSKKQALTYIDFNDYEHYAYQILSAKEGYVAKILQQRYQEIMIDEFQDTSSSQYAIISQLANNNLFLVGDIKQSIYRFRNANPSIMTSLLADDSFHKVTIPSNFRSRENIIEFNNQFFSRLMNLEKKESYRSTDYQEAPDFRKNLSDNIQIRFVNGLVTEQNQEKERRALLLVQEILKAKEEGVPFKDMAVLLLIHRDENFICRILRQYNIPHFVNEKKSYFSSLAMKSFLNFLHLVLEPQHRRYRVAVLQAFYRLNDDELYLCKQENFSHPRLDKDLTELRQFYHQQDLFAILKKISNIENFYQKLPDSEQINIDFFFENFPRLPLYTVEDLLHYMEVSREKNEVNPSDSSEDSPVVKIMTVHHSKGLDFDTVFFMMNHSEQTRARNFVSDEQLGIAFPFYLEDKEYIPIQKAAITFKDTIENRAEKQRLLYVALTRAKRKMVLIDAMKEDHEKQFLEDTLFYEKKGFNSYIQSLMNPHELIEIENTSQEPNVYFYDDEKTTEKDVEPLPIYHFSTKQEENIRPSALEKHDDNLSFEAIYGMEYGTRIHELFEKIDYQASPEERYHLLPDDINESEKEILTSFVNHPLIQSLLPESEFLQEFPFYLKEEDKLQHGYMDLLIRNDKEIILIDYKTDNGVSEEMIKERYTPQQKAYADALRKKYPHAKLSAYLYLTALQKFINLEV